MTSTNSSQQGCVQKGLTLLGVAVAFVALLAALVLLIAAPIAAWTGFKSMSNELQVALSAGIITILGSVVSLIYSNQVSSRQKIEQSLYEKKQPVYDKLLEFLFNIMKNAKNGVDVDEDEVLNFLISFSKDLMLWGSDDVIRAYVNWRKIAGSNPSPAQMLLSLEDLFLAIRVDFGHKNKGIEKGDLMSFIITDTDEWLKEQGSASTP